MSGSGPGRAADLRELSYPEVEGLLGEARPSVAIIPTGSTEAHGPHLPLSTDTLISEEVAGRAAAKLAAKGWNAVRFGPLHYGVTDWAASFGGTTTISAEVIHGLVMEACLQARGMGFTRVSITNAHLEPGHIGTLRAVSRAISRYALQVLAFADQDPDNVAPARRALAPIDAFRRAAARRNNNRDDLDAPVVDPEDDFPLPEGAPAPDAPIPVIPV